MEPIRPIEGVVTDKQTQAMAMADIVRERYYAQRAHEAAPVEPGENAAKTSDKDKRKLSSESKPPPPASGAVRRTYAEFDVNQETRDVLVRIFDSDSGELVRVIPPDQLAQEIASGDLPLARMRRLTIHL